MNRLLSIIKILNAFTKDIGLVFGTTQSKTQPNLISNVFLGVQRV